MQKRKAPVFLFGLVILALSGMAIWNATTRPAGAPHDEPVHEEGVKEKEVSAEEREQAKKDLANALPKPEVRTPLSTPTGKKVGVMPDEGTGKSLALAKDPTILLPKFSSYRPKPNDSSTATHWYDESSRSAKVAQENKSGRG